MRCLNALRAVVLTGVTLAVGSAGLSAIAQTPPLTKRDPGHAVAERKTELDEQFRRLKAAKGAHAAAPIVANIWKLWMRSGRPGVDRLMQEAVATMQLREYDHALIQFNQIIEIAPEYAEGWNKRATLLYLMDAHDRSLADIMETLKREPRHFGALAGRGMIHVARKNWQKALEAYRAALAVNPFIQAGRDLIPELEKMVEEQEI
ncbi:hypothetical protein MnTg02_00039 [bacterium MnTg02]|nr:hypothetical protein MnTg02_00039 [bacterium MnTg02]